MQVFTHISAIRVHSRITVGWISFRLLNYAQGNRKKDELQLGRYEQQHVSPFIIQKKNTYLGNYAGSSYLPFEEQIQCLHNQACMQKDFSYSREVNSRETSPWGLFQRRKKGCTYNVRIKLLNFTRLNRKVNNVHHFLSNNKQKTMHCRKQTEISNLTIMFAIMSNIESHVEDMHFMTSLWIMSLGLGTLSIQHLTDLSVSGSSGWLWSAVCRILFVTLQKLLLPLPTPLPPSHHIIVFYKLLTAPRCLLW